MGPGEKLGHRQNRFARSRRGADQHVPKLPPRRRSLDAVDTPQMGSAKKQCFFIQGMGGEGCEFMGKGEAGIVQLARAAAKACKSAHEDSGVGEDSFHSESSR